MLNEHLRYERQYTWQTFNHDLEIDIHYIGGYLILCSEEDFSILVYNA